MHVVVFGVITFLAVMTAMLPAFGILYLFSSFLPEDPQGFLESIIYFIQTVIIWFIGFIVIFAYSDVAFPLVFLTMKQIYLWDKEKIALQLFDKFYELREKFANQQEADIQDYQEPEQSSVQAEVNSKSD